MLEGRRSEAKQIPQTRASARFKPDARRFATLCSNHRDTEMTVDNTNAQSQNEICTFETNTCSSYYESVGGRSLCVRVF